MAKGFKSPFSLVGLSARIRLAYRSLLAFWMGGASGQIVIPEPEPPDPTPAPVPSPEPSQPFGPGLPPPGGFFDIPCAPDEFPACDCELACLKAAPFLTAAAAQGCLTACAAARPSCNACTAVNVERGSCFGACNSKLSEDRDICLVIPDADDRADCYQNADLAANECNKACEVTWAQSLRNCLHAEAQCRWTACEVSKDSHSYRRYQCDDPYTWSVAHAWLDYVPDRYACSRDYLNCWYGCDGDLVCQSECDRAQLTCQTFAGNRLEIAVGEGDRTRHLCLATADGYQLQRDDRFLPWSGFPGRYKRSRADHDLNLCWAGYPDGSKGEAQLQYALMYARLRYIICLNAAEGDAVKACNADYTVERKSALLSAMQHGFNCCQVHRGTDKWQTCWFDCFKAREICIADAKILYERTVTDAELDNPPGPASELRDSQITRCTRTFESCEINCHSRFYKDRTCARCNEDVQSVFNEGGINLSTTQLVEPFGHFPSGPVVTTPLV